MSSGNKKADAYALARRCVDAGWTMTETTTGLRVKSPRGQVVVIHKTVDNLTSAHKRLKDAGLHDDEAKAKRVSEGKRLHALAANRKAEADSLRRAQADIAKRNDDLLQRAAGPDAVCDMPLSWYTTAHPTPMMRWCRVTPAIALALLSTNTANYRTMSERYRDYRRDIETGYWRLTHQGIAIDADGVLQDGQHRLRALSLVERDISVVMPVFVGMPTEAVNALDAGKARQAGDAAKHVIGAQGHAAATVARLILAVTDGGGRARRYGTQEIIDTLEKDPEGYISAVNEAWGLHRQAGLIVTAGAAFILLQRQANGAHNPYVRVFLRGVRTGAKGPSRIMLDDDDPRQVLRRHVSTHTGRLWRAPAQLHQMIVAWNNTVAGRHPRGMALPPRTYAMPEILRCDPDTSQVPPALRGEVDQ